MIHCPLCNADIDVEEDELDEGDSLICEECGKNLNVSSVSPLELKADTEGDVDDDDDDDDDDADDYDEEDDDEDEDEDDED